MQSDVPPLDYYSMILDGIVEGTHPVEIFRLGSTLIPITDFDQKQLTEVTPPVYAFSCFKSSIKRWSEKEINMIIKLPCETYAYLFVDCDPTEEFWHEHNINITLCDNIEVLFKKGIPESRSSKMTILIPFCKI